jgi:hypothetical protein
MKSDIEWKRAAEKAVARVAGVRGIVVDMEVCLPRHDERSDETATDREGEACTRPAGPARWRQRQTSRQEGS